MAPLLLIGAALGGAAMYLLDPDKGRRRRALIRDQGVKAMSNVRDMIDAASRDLANRGAGVGGRTRSLFWRRKATDDVLVERVRAKMGRYVSHPHSIEVTASDGQVVLSGAILRHEHMGLLAGVRAVPGVMDILDQLTVYDSAEGVSELQGGRPRPGERMELFQENWAPGTRLIAGTAGTTLALYALRGGLPGLLLGAAGALILLRSTMNKPLRELAGMGGRKGIDIQKTININAPVDQVFEFLSNYQNFPQFMRNVRSVETRAGGRSHWKVAGPAGATVQWDSETSELVPNKVIAWRTVRGSAVEHAGFIHLEPAGEGTRVHIQMSYNPPAGAVGHAVAKLLGADPKTELDEDMMRLKSTLETGKPPRDAAQREASDIVSG